MTATAISDSDLLRAFIDALSELQRHPTSLVWPGTVESFNSTSNTAKVKVDGSSDAVAMVSLIGALATGQRVSVLFDPPHGAFVLANGTTGGTTGGGTGGTGGGMTQEQIEDLLGGGFLVGGTNITLNYDDGANTLTINTSALAAEQVEDLLGLSFIVQGQNIRIVYNDGANTLTFSVTQLDTALDANGHTINNLPDPSLDQQAATKHYVDTHTTPSDLAFPFFMGTS